MIYETNEPFDFQNKITFLSPKSISSGNYLIRCFAPNQTPLFIQSPKCKSRQKIVKSGKKMYCDLVFSQFDESFLKWIEDFEHICHETLFKNRAEWFDSELENEDIENSFASSCKVYQSGKQHVLRANIPLRLGGKCGLKIYDESEQEVEIDTIIENTSLITILEIQGIRCSSRNFAIEYEIKQMMVLSPIDLFDKCILGSKKPGNLESQSGKKEVSLINIEVDTLSVIPTMELVEVSNITNNVEKKEVEKKEEKEVEEDEEKEEEVKMTDLDLGKEEKDICEIELELLNVEDVSKEEVVHLKNRKEVYYEMYKEAKKKAKMAKEFALSAYLEAKRIKNTYLLDEVMDDSDSNEEEDFSTKSLEDIK
jgi:hypothetical protein